MSNLIKTTAQMGLCAAVLMACSVPANMETAAIPEPMGANEAGQGVMTDQADKAVMAEWDAARQANTVKGYQMFMRRHPDHPVAKTAKLCAQAVEQGAERPAECASPN